MNREAAALGVPVYSIFRGKNRRGGPIPFGGGKVDSPPKHPGCAKQASSN